MRTYVREFCNKKYFFYIYLNYIVLELYEKTSKRLFYIYNVYRKINYLLRLAYIELR